jgi:hypothetical protein
MTPRLHKVIAVAGRRQATCAAVVAVVAVVLGGAGLSGCAIVRAVKHVTHIVEGNRSIINTFTAKLKNGGATTFEATYVTTGSAPTTVVYAVKPPKGLAFQSLPSSLNDSNGGDVSFIVNSAGEYSCDKSSASSGWSCDKLDPATAIVKKQIFSFYTPSHWVAFLRGFALAAGFAGDKVTTSNMTVNGFSMNCVDFVASGVKGTSTICTTSQGILGYVKVASTNASFQIKSYTSSPPASLFGLPPGAKITNLQKGAG